MLLSELAHALTCGTKSPTSVIKEPYISPKTALVVERARARLDLRHKEPYINDKRALYLLKRALYLPKKSPTSMIKEPYISPKEPYISDKRALYLPKKSPSCSESLRTLETCS